MKHLLLQLTLVLLCLHVNGQISLEAEIITGNEGGNPDWLTEYDGNLYFQADDGIHGKELWRFDGTNASMVEDLRAGELGSEARYLNVFNGKLYFTGNDGTNNGLWSYDGTEFSFESEVGFEPRGRPLLYQGDVYYAASDSIHGEELWRYNGISSSLVADINLGTEGSGVGHLIVFEDELVFQAADGVHGRELWSYDGNTVSMVADINVGPDSSIGGWLTNFNDKIYFPADDGISGSEIWSYDGVNVELELELNTGFGSNPKFLTVFNDKLYFQGRDNDAFGIWSYDGTNPQMEVEISASEPADLYYAFYLTPYNGRLYFAGWSLEYGTELYRIDNNDAELIQDLYPGNNGFVYPLNYFVNCEYAGKLFFAADNGSTGWELWSLNETVGITESEIANVTAYPNPTADRVRVMFDRTVRDTQIKVFDSFGKLVRTNEIDDLQTIDINLPECSGLYIVQFVSSDGQSTILKVVKD